MPETLQIRIHGPGTAPTLIYLPGLHGDWTLVGGFRQALAGRARFVEFTYPRTLTWSLDDYAAQIEKALAENGIATGWLLGESFGSQVVWPLLARGRFQVQGIILAGGFVRHPMNWGVRFAEWIAGGVPLALITRVLFGYASWARIRFRRSPETLAGIQEFIAHQTKLNRQAAIHRLQLITRSNPCAVAHKASIPVYTLTKFFDPI